MPQPPVENTRYLEFVKRVVRRAGERVGQADDWDLAELIELRDEVETTITKAVAGLRAQGHSWAYIAVGLGTTRQGAFKRYGKTTDQSIGGGE